MAVKESTYLSEPITWSRSNDAEYPYESVYDGRRLTLRVNDFPEEHFYTLLVDNNENTSFDDWPDTWVHPEDSSRSVFISLDGAASMSAAIYLREILESLTPFEHQLFLLRWVEERSFEEIAHVLASDVNAVRHKINGLRARLRARSKIFNSSRAHHLGSEKVDSESV
jgi:DNA-directed RNA polymerase specialized sigma24 family protein